MMLTPPAHNGDSDKAWSNAELLPSQNSVDREPSAGSIASLHGTISSIQLLRFLAASLVVFGHAQLFAISRNLLPSQFKEFDPVDFRTGVDIFFVVSGFVMYYVSSNHFANPGYPRYFLVRRIIRIIPLYWATTGAMLFAILIAPSMIQHSLLAWQQVFCSFFFLPYDAPSIQYSFPLVGVGWTLNYEMFFYLCFFFVVALPRLTAMLVLSIGFMSAAILHAIFLSQTYIRFLSEWTNPIILEFLFGIGLALLFERGFRWSIQLGSIVALCGIFCLILVRNVVEVHDLDTYRPIIWGLPALLVCAGLAFSDGSYIPSRLRGIMISAGNLSFALYLTHEFTFNAISIVWRSMRLSNSWVLIAVLCVTSTAVSFVIYHFFERPITGRLNCLLSIAPHRLEGSSVDVPIWRL